MPTTSLRNFRVIAFLEGVSFILLVGIAVPLKYFANSPAPVKYFGWVHGVLFMLYVFALILVWIQERWPFLKVLLAFLASLLPFGPFVFDAKYLRPQK